MANYALAVTSWKLTGARRYRTSERSCGYRRNEPIILLQVEERRSVQRERGDEIEHRWRDAHPDDLLQTIEPE